MRPEIYSDLEPSQRKGTEVFRIEMSMLPAQGPILTALGNFLAVAERTLTAERSYGTVYLRLPPTEQELEQALSDAKENWDRDKTLYEAAEISGTEPEDYTKHRIRNWAKKENLPLPWEKS